MVCRGEKSSVWTVQGQRVGKKDGKEFWNYFYRPSGDLSWFSKQGDTSSSRVCAEHSYQPGAVLGTGETATPTQTGPLPGGAH